MTKSYSPRIIVSNAMRMHTHQFCVGLEKKNLLDTFYTTIWYRPNSKINKLICAMPFMGKKIKHDLLKRYEEKLPTEKVKTYSRFEVLRQIKRKIPFLKQTEDWVFEAGKKFDKHVSKQIKKKHFDIFVGYETVCLKSFMAAKQKGKITIMDLTQVHWNYIQSLREKSPIYKSIQEDWLFRKISAVKEAEYKYVDFIFVLSELMKKSLLDVGIDEKKIYLTNLGFDPKKFKCKKTYCVDPNRPLQLLFVGSVARGKGIRLLLEAVKQSFNTHLTIVGTVADEATSFKKYERYYTHIPFLHHQELAKQYREADLFVFPSYLDSWAMVVLEAMASGTPVIVTENTGAKDAVAKGGGKIIPVDDLEALKSAIEYYHTDRRRLQEDGLTANRVAQNYTWDNYHERINNIILDIVQQRIPNS